MYICKHLGFLRSISIFLGIAFLFVWSGCEKKGMETPTVSAPFLHQSVAWTDSLLLELSLEEKLGQLLYWEGDSLASEDLADWVTQGLIGGLQLPGYQLEDYLQLTDSLREISALPLFFGTEQPTILFNHFSDLPAFPLPLTLAGIRADSVELQLSALYAEQCRAVGINLVHAPQIRTYHPSDTSFSPAYFSDNQQLVTQRALRLTRSLLARHILPVGQSIDALLPVGMDSTEMEAQLLPFRQLTRQGICGWSLSPQLFPLDTAGRGEGRVLSNYLDQHLGFDGLIVTSVVDTATLREQLFAGSDLLKISDAPTRYIDAMKFWLEKGWWTETELHQRLDRLWKAKEWMNTSRDTLDYEENIEQWIVHDHYELMRQELFQQSISIANDPQCLLPLQDIHHQRFIVLTVGEAPLKVFPEYVNNYASVRNQFFRNPDFPAFPTRALRRAKRSTVFFVLDQVDLDTMLHGPLIQTINDLAAKTRVILLNFGNPYELRHFDPSITMLQITERNELTEALAAQAIFGGIAVAGQLPVQIARHLPRGKQNERDPIRLAYKQAEAAGVERYRLSGIDAIMHQAIRRRVMPGGQVFVIKSGNVIYDKSFGYHTYKKRRRVKGNDLYDIASVTKVAATTLGVMRLYEQGRIQLKDKLRKHLPIPTKSKVGGISVEQLLSHRSGLSPNMPVANFISARKRKRYWFDCNEYYCQSSGEEPYTLPIADSVYLDPRWIDSIWQEVYHMRVSRRKRVRYSDANFNLLQKLVETKTKRGLDKYLFNTIYRPLHLRHLTYKPLDHFGKKQLVPTARDNMWRHQLVHGYVHDESAALLGGVAGNAGLFANARDLGVLFQMLLNGGTYGGRDFFQAKTIETFAQTRQKNRRAFGFERKTKSTLRGCSPKASRKTYGHTGFTGSAVWVDPEHDLVFVFLANRVHPNPKNYRIFNKKIRERVHSVVYDALDSYTRPELPEWRVPPVLPEMRPTDEEIAVRAGR